MAVVGGLITIGGLLIDDGGADAPLVMQPMDESILEFEFAGSQFDTGYFSSELITEQDVLDGNYDFTEIALYIVGDPVYGDFDGDNDLDAALQVAPMAGGATPVLYVWLWEDGEVVQGPYPAAWPSDCGDRMDSFSVVDNLIQVEMEVGDSCTVDMDLVPVTFTVAVEDGFPVQVEPGYGAVQQCANHDHYPVLDEPDDVPLYVAQNQESPEMDPVDYERIEVLDFTSPYGPPEASWRLARVTAPDGTVNCAWTPAG